MKVSANRFVVKFMIMAAMAVVFSPPCLRMVEASKSSGNSVVMTGRQIFSDRIQKYVYFSTSSIEKALSTVNKTDADSLDAELSFQASRDPLSINWLNGEEICVSNTLFASVFTVLTFSTACYVVVGLQILNQFEKEKKK